MNLLNAGRRIFVSAVVFSLMFAAPVWAQEAEQSQVDRMQSMENEPTDPSFNAPYTLNVSFGVGTASGANPIGSFVDEDEGRIFTFDLDSGVLFSGRVARRVWWRRGVEGEFGYASPGVLVTETSLQGLNVTTEPFADYSMGYVAASLRVDLVDARVTPFLLGGLAVVFSSYDDTQVAPAEAATSSSGTDLGFIFGGGLDVRIKEGINLRGDVRGLRSNVDAPLLSRGILEQFEENRSALSTQILWTLGIAVRF